MCEIFGRVSRGSRTTYWKRGDECWYIMVFHGDSDPRYCALYSHWKRILCQFKHAANSKENLLETNEITSSQSAHSVKVTTHLKLLYIPNRMDLSGLHTPSRSSFTSELPALQPITDIFGRVLITDEINFSHYCACQQPVQSAKWTSNGTPRISYIYRNVRWAAAKTDF